MTEPLPPHLWEFRKIIAKWEHGEINLEQLYEALKDKLTPKQLSFI